MKLHHDAAIDSPGIGLDSLPSTVETIAAA